MSRPSDLPRPGRYPKKKRKCRHFPWPPIKPVPVPKPPMEPCDAMTFQGGCAELERLVERFVDVPFGVNVRRSGITVSFASNVVDDALLEEYGGVAAKYEVVTAFIEDVLRSDGGSEDGWLTPLDPGRYEWEGRDVPRVSKEWRTSIDYVYSQMVTKGMLDTVTRMHQEEHVAHPGCVWEVRSCHEQYQGVGPEVMQRLTPRMYHRITRIRLRRRKRQ